MRPLQKKEFLLREEYIIIIVLLIGKEGKENSKYCMFADKRFVIINAHSLFIGKQLILTMMIDMFRKQNNKISWPYFAALIS